MSDDKMRDFQEQLAIKAGFTPSYGENPSEAIHEEFSELKKLISYESQFSRNELKEQFRRLEAALLICLGAITAVVGGLFVSGNRSLIAIGAGIVLVYLGSRERSKEITPH